MDAIHNAQKKNDEEPKKGVHHEADVFKLKSIKQMQIDAKVNYAVQVDIDKATQSRGRIGTLFFVHLLSVIW